MLNDRARTFIPRREDCADCNGCGCGDCDFAGRVAVSCEVCGEIGALNDDDLCRDCYADGLTAPELAALRMGNLGLTTRLPDPMKARAA